MKQIPSDALRSQLARSRHVSAHPDADQLTAFAENTLLPGERSGILAHLAACPSCREILRTAAAAAEPESASIAQPQLQPARSPLRAWLPGMAIAASLIALAGSAVLLYHATRANVSRNQTARNAHPALVAAQPPLPASVPEFHPAPAPPLPQLSAPKRRPSSPRAKPSAEPAPAVVIATQEAPVQAQAPPTPLSLGVIAGTAPQTEPAPARQAQISGLHGTMSAAKAASRGPAATRFEPQNAFAESSHALASVNGQLVASPAVRAHWRIGDSGLIERSTEPGVWQPVFIAPDMHFRVLSVSGADLWAGGDRLRLFHSADDGRTWLEVHLPSGADRTRAIAHIRVESQQKIVVEADDATTWATTDGGQTWQ